MTFNPFSRQKSLDEAQEDKERLDTEDERLGVEVSIAKKKLMIRELKKRGLTAKHFGDTSVGATWTKIWEWLKTH